MPRLAHGATIRPADLVRAVAAVAENSAEVPFAFAAALPANLQKFDFLFPNLQNAEKNLLLESAATRDNLIKLGRAMHDPGDGPTGDSVIPAAYTYFGQFIDHDVTLETTSATADDLVKVGLVPLPLNQIRSQIQNLRSATLDLDSVYGLPAPRDGQKMKIGDVTNLPPPPPGQPKTKPSLRPDHKGDDNDVPREKRSNTVETDRAALIGDPRNDENLVIAQMQVAFLKAHNALVDSGNDFDGARRLLRQHYQHLVLSDFLPRICDTRLLGRIRRDGNLLYKQTLQEPFFLPLEYAVAAYRFGHTMIRTDYDFNLNFNTSKAPGTFDATLGLLFTFTALQGQLGDFDTLPENWIIEWDGFVDVGKPFNRARRFDTKLVEPLFALQDMEGNPEVGDKGRLAVRNLLRGYLLRIPTGQAVATAVRSKYGATDAPVLRPDQVVQGAASPEQAQILVDAGFDRRTPLWYYILAEASVLGKGQRLGPVGTALVAEVLFGLVLRSEDSILQTKGWKPTLPSTKPGKFELADLLRLGGVL